MATSNIRSDKTAFTLMAGVLMLLAVISGLAFMDKPQFTSPKGYDLNRPVKYNMPEKLHEISGIAFHHGNADTIYAEQDEAGKIYYFHPGDKDVSHANFAKPGDFEDITILNEQIVMLRSDGVLFTFPFKGIRNKDIAGVKKWNNILPSGEYEGLCADERTGQLFVLCKHCKTDNTKKASSGYIFKLSADGSVKQSGTFSVNVKDIEAISRQGKLAFHPSAITKNPQTNEWYILSSVNKMLVVADAGWKIKAVHPINPAIFKQPEGIAFDSQNNLYISNEGDKVTPGNVLKFAYTR